MTLLHKKYKICFLSPSLSFPLSLSPSSSLQVIIHYLWQCQTFTPNSILSDFTSQWWKEQRQTGSFIMAGRLSLLTQTPWAGRSNHHQWLRGNFPWGAGQKKKGLNCERWTSWRKCQGFDIQSQSGDPRMWGRKLIGIQPVPQSTLTKKRLMNDPHYKEP